MTKEAYLYEKIDDDKVHCLLCNHGCVIKPGKRGICGVRENRSGTLLSLVYGKIIAGHCDPIEKKPLFHFLPGSLSFSIATAGCNFRCLFCQNSDISQMAADSGRIVGDNMTPGEIVAAAERAGADSISYTYTEPTVYYETAVDTGRIAVDRGLKNVFVTNGYMTEMCLDDLHPALHAANVDLKAFSDSFYRDQCGARLAPVIRTIENMKEKGVWLEVTTLLIPGLNDSPEELKGIAAFLAELDPNIPWHISRFHPTYRLTGVPSTPAKAIKRAEEIGKEEGLKYVYTGNLPGDDGEKTYCHGCGGLLIDRFGFQVSVNRIRDGHCPECDARIPGEWNN